MVGRISRAGAILVAALAAALDRHPEAAFAMARVCHAAAPDTVQFDGAGAAVV